jgi:hypothetical protein
VLALPIASIAWTVTHEEVFEFCFSHYVTALFLLITRFKLLFDDWRGYLIAGFSLVWIADIYMSFFGRLRLDIKEERAEIEAIESTQRSGRRDPYPIRGWQRGRGPS